MAKEKIKVTLIKSLIGRTASQKGTVVGLADGILYADDKAIYEAENLKVGLFK